MSITLWRERDRSLGIQLGGHRANPGIFIHEILPESVASLDGRLRTHDKILAINGHDVRHSRIDAAARLIERSRSSITLSISISNRTATPSDGTSVCSNVSESLSEHSSNNSSPRIFSNSPQLDNSNSSRRSSGKYNTDLSNEGTSTPMNSKSSPTTVVYPSSDVSSTTTTDTDDSDSPQAHGSCAPSPRGDMDTWLESDRGNQSSLSEEERWPSLPEKPRLAQKTAIIKKVIF